MEIEMRQTSQKLSKMKVHLAIDRPATQIDFVLSDGSTHSLFCTAADLSVLIAEMGAARARMVAGTTVPSLRGVRVPPVYNPHWLVQHEPLTDGSAVFFQHPAFGPLAFIIPRHEVHELATALASHADVQMTTPLPNLKRVIN
jgi:hypothetical protein